MAAERNYLLDGMRGAAAIAVVAFHMGGILQRDSVPAGFLAVDFFFVLSGFVIASAYDGRFARGMDWQRFLVVRAVRLYPLFALGMAFGIVKSAAQVALHDQHALNHAQFLMAVPLNAAMLPAPFDYPEMFPFNTPAWSLFCEVAINIVYALFLVRTRSGTLAMIALVGGAVMILGCVLDGAGLHNGADRHTAIYGLARVTFSFCVGMLIARRVAGAPPRPAAWALWLLPALLAAFFAPASGWGIMARDLLFAFVVSPVIVLVGARVDVPAAWRRPFALLGDVSYPLYAIHYPLLLAFSFVALRMHLPTALIFAAGLAGTLVAAFLAAHFYDRPVRRWLSERLQQRESAPPQVA